jgi:hypothetical protein
MAFFRESGEPLRPPRIACRALSGFDTCWATDTQRASSRVKRRKRIVFPDMGAVSVFVQGLCAGPAIQ